jgi:hypothetical protein
MQSYNFLLKFALQTRVTQVGRWMKFFRLMMKGTASSGRVEIAFHYTNCSSCLSSQRNPRLGRPAFCGKIKSFFVPNFVSFAYNNWQLPLRQLRIETILLYI